MKRMKRAALLTRLIERLSHNESWCGETHIQKAAYFVQCLTGIPMEFDFILYKHGPFSFDLRDELTAMRADGLLMLRAQWPFGAQILPTEQSERIQELYPKTLKKYEDRIEFVAEELGHKGVVELERLATAMYVSMDMEDDASVEKRAARVTELKRHISMTEALDAVREFDLIAANVPASTH